MTVSTIISKSGPYAGAGTTGPFTVGFRFLENAHLRVVRTDAAGLDTDLALTTDYTVSGAGASTGTVTLVAALAAGQKLTILRNVPATQEADYVQNDAFPAESHEIALDKLTMLAQQNTESLGRSLLLPPSVAAGVSAQLPSPLANTVFGWDETGTALKNLDPQVLATIAAYGFSQPDVFTGDGVTTSWTLSYSPAALGNIDVTIGGVGQIPSDDYQWPGGLVFTTTVPVPNGVKMLVRYAQALPTQDSALRVYLAAAGGAGMVGNAPSGTISATTVQGAINEIVSDLAASPGASTVGYLPAGAGAVANTAQGKLRESVSIKDFGCIGNGIADDTAALVKVKAALEAGAIVHGLKGTYLTSTPLRFTVPVSLIGEDGFRIKLTAPAAYVVQVDGSGSGSAWMYGPRLENIILDGGGFSTDGLSVKHVVSGYFDDIRTTNVTGAGLHLVFAQCCTFHNYTCSRNVEAFTTTPVNGLLADGLSSSANLFTNPAIEHVTGSGIKGISLVNTVFINGTSEGNAIGIELGEAVAGSQTAIGNSFIGMDLEVNSTSDIVLRLTASVNDFIGLKAGFMSPDVQILGSSANTFFGGTVGGFNMDAASKDNRISGVKLIGAGKTVTNAGTRNHYQGVYNISDATVIPDSMVRGRVNNVLGAGATAAIDAATTSYSVVSATGATVTIGGPTNPSDAQALDVTIHNISGGALTVTWNAAFKIAGWVNPATGTNRSVRFIYDSNYGAWYAASMSATDVPN